MKNMAYKIVKTDSFQRDLDAVIGYIAIYLENKIAAAALMDAIEKSYKNLVSMPLMYEACQNPRLKELGYRKAVIQNYIMIYKVIEEEKIIKIMRFFHGRQDYEKRV